LFPPKSGYFSLQCQGMCVMYMYMCIYMYVCTIGMYMIDICVHMYVCTMRVDTYIHTYLRTCIHTGAVVVERALRMYVCK
jgi:hypothetical protein